MCETRAGHSGESIFVAFGGRMVPPFLVAIAAMLGGNTMVFGQTTPASKQKDAAEPPSLTLLIRETSALLKDEATAKSAAKKDAATAALCDMYVVLRRDQRYPTSTTLQGEAAKIRRRLLRVAKRRENELVRRGVERPSTLASDVDAAIDAAIKRAEGDASERKTSASGVSSADASSAPVGRSRSPQVGAAGGALDEGWRLVELIERVVAPDFWQSRGGPGAVHYFAMRKVLVVSATSDVHEQIKDLLRALR